MFQVLFLAAAVASLHAVGWATDSDGAAHHVDAAFCGTCPTGTDYLRMTRARMSTYTSMRPRGMVRGAGEWRNAHRETPIKGAAGTHTRGAGRTAPAMPWWGLINDKTGGFVFAASQGVPHPELLARVSNTRAKANASTSPRPEPLRVGSAAWPEALLGTVRAVLYAWVDKGVLGQLFWVGVPMVRVPSALLCPPSRLFGAQPWPGCSQPQKVKCLHRHARS